MLKRKLFPLSIACLLTSFVFAQHHQPMQHPDWIKQGNIYEVNTRQYTPEGTFKAFQQHLPRLKAMGVQTLWFMPINPISKTDRKGVLGSYYAVSDYKAINPEYGNIADWKNLVNAAHAMGMKVIIDWVPNHSGADHPWLTTNPDFYVKDDKGNFVAPFDWTDVRKLNYKNPKLVESMIDAMRFWVKETDIDGFRCDVAGEVPAEFWSKCIPELKKLKDVFMLAEGNDPWLHDVGFNATYPWDAFHTMKLIASGDRPAFAIDSVLKRIDTTYRKGAIRMYFTSNHDENSWNKADYATMPGEKHAPFAVLTQTIQASVPLIYSGQEEPVLDSLSFFYKDTIHFSKYKRAPFYTTLLKLRKNNPALAVDAAFTKLSTSNDAAIYAFERSKGKSKILVITNLSNNAQTVSFTTKPSAAKWKNVFTGKTENIRLNLKPWDYLVYEYKP